LDAAKRQIVDGQKGNKRVFSTENPNGTVDVYENADINALGK
jgi:hypothetical protein